MALTTAEGRSRQRNRGNGTPAIGGFGGGVGDRVGG